MKTKTLIFIFFASLIFYSGSVFAQISSEYYERADGLKNSDLKTELHLIVKDHVRLSYGSLWTYFRDTDWHPDGYYWDMYSNNKVSTSGGSMNKEHSFPKSWWGGNTGYDAYSDLFHLYPTNSTANSQRSNYPLGEVGIKTRDWTNGVIKTGSNAFSFPSGEVYRGTVFEPADEFKGDLARTFFYMVTCYQDYTWKGNAVNMLNQDAYPTFQPWAVELLLKWHRNDPVSEKEIVRNEAVYKHQKNRNPFIDHPELAEHLWGDRKDDVFDLSGQGEPKPRVTVDNTLLVYSTMDLNTSHDATVIVKASNLTQDLTVSIVGDNVFSITKTTLTKEDVEQLGGYELIINYTPVEYGSTSASLTIDGEDLSSPITVGLQGTASVFSGEILNAPFLTGFDDFTHKSVVGDQLWKHDPKYKNLNMSGYVDASKSNKANEDWLLSPVIDFSDISSATLSYSYTISKGRGNTVTKEYMQSHQTVWVTDNYTGDPSTTVWVQLENVIYPTGKDWDFVNESITFPSSLMGKPNVVIAFKYTCDNTDSATWQLNNLRVSGEGNAMSVESENYKNNNDIYLTIGFINIFVDSDIHIVEIYNDMGRLIVKQKVEQGWNSIPVESGKFLLVKRGNKTLKVISK